MLIEDQVTVPNVTITKGDILLVKAMLFYCQFYRSNLVAEETIYVKVRAYRNVLAEIGQTSYFPLVHT
jgi:hypothetical protein